MELVRARRRRHNESNETNFVENGVRGQKLWPSEDPGLTLDSSHCCNSEPGWRTVDLTLRLNTLYQVQCYSIFDEQCPGQPDLANTVHRV